MQSFLDRLQQQFNSRKGFPTRLAELPRLTLACFLLALLLAAALVLANLVGFFNPYQTAQAQVAETLAFHPDLENRLDYTRAAAIIFGQELHPEIAQQINIWNDSLSPGDIAALAGMLEVQPQEMDIFNQWMNLLAREILALYGAISTGDQTLTMAAAISYLRDNPENIAVEQMQLLHSGIPPILERMNALRAQGQRIDALARQIGEDSPIPAILAGFEFPDHALSAYGALLQQGYMAWNHLPERSASLEIQFVNNIAVLEEIFLAIDAARRTDRAWGYSIWQPIAAWLQQRTVAVLLLVVILLSVAILRYYWTPEQLFNPLQRVKPLLARLRLWLVTLSIRPVAALRGNKPYLQQSRILVNRLIQQPQRTQPASQPVSENARIVVVFPNGSRREYRLPQAGIFRIGSDPAFPVTTPNNPRSYVEVWIRKAHRRYIVEVMFSDDPVLLNRNPISASRVLYHGDLIQVQELHIIYLGQ